MIETSLRMTEYKILRMKKAGVDCIVDACPFCHLQYDAGQKELKEAYNIPVLHYSQLLGLALGYTVEEAGLHLNETINQEFDEKIALMQK